MRSFMVVLLFLTFLISISYSKPSEQSQSQSQPLEVFGPLKPLFCQKCQLFSSFVTRSLTHVEKIVQTILTSVLGNLCHKIPKTELTEAICEVLEKNFVEAVVLLIEGIQKQLSPNILCQRVCSK
uniref:Saposin B-type domain-containing protein n=2 Tax=Caenorhabditis japonica TaxID=281687 RepID=A0A8R1DEV6_CAEJA